MKKYDIDAVRCYQAVMFNKSQHTFFASRQINAAPPIELEFYDDIGIISIKSERDHILIPITNVSAIYLKSPIKIEQAEKDQKERDYVVTPEASKRPLRKVIVGR